MKNKLAGKIVTFISVLSILLQSFSPFAALSNNYAYADEMDSASSPQVAPTEAPVLEEVTTTTIAAITTTTTIPEVTITPTPETEDNNEIVVPTISLDPQPSQPLSQWTFEKVELNKEYVAPQNSGVKLTFTKLPDPSGNIKIEEITLTEEQVEKTGALSNKAYDITSDMKDGEFSYTLSLPIPESSRGKEVEVKFAEELSKIEEAKEVENTLTKTDTSVSVSNLDHFTIFIITDDSATYSGGTWIDYATQGYSEDGVHYLATVPSGQTATWTFSSIITPDSYKVYVSWSTHPNRTTSAPYTLNYNGGNTSFNINQEQLADQITTGSPTQWSGWYYVGTFNLNSSSSLVLTSVDNSSGTDYVIADEVLIAPNIAPSTVWVDDDYGINSKNDGHVWEYDAFTSIQEGVEAVTAGGNVNIAGGTYNIDTTIVLNKALTISGSTSDISKTQGTNPSAVSIFEIASSNITIQNLEVTHNALAAGLPSPWAELPNSLIRIPALGVDFSSINILDNKLYVPSQTGAMNTWNGVAITVGSSAVSSVSITGNTIYNTRNGIVVQGNNKAIIANNIIHNTKGGIMNYTSNLADANNRTISNNSWETVHNEWDIVWNTAYYVPDYQQSVLNLSKTNNDAYVLDRRANDASTCANLTGNRSHIFVDDDSTVIAAHPAKGNFNEPFKTIVLGIEAVVSGGIIYVAEGNYPNNLQINKPLLLQGANSEINPNTEARIAESVIEGQGGIAVNVTDDDVIIKGFTINNLTGKEAIYAVDHKNLSILNNIIENIKNASGNVYGIAIVSSSLDVSGIQIKNNKISAVHYTGSLDPGFSAGGIALGWSNGSKAFNDVIIENNNISNIRSNTSPWKVGHGAYGILVNHFNNNLQIKNNNIHDLEGLWAHGIGLEGDTPNAVVTGNIINDLVDHKSPSDAIGVQFEDNPSAGTVTINGNIFTNMLVNIQNTVNGTTVDGRNNTWSVVNQNNLDQIEEVINHNCANLLYPHGICDTADNSGYGFVRYADIEKPVNSGWNVKSKSSTPNETPLDLVCSTGTLYVNENSVAQNWSAVGGVNTKYQREVTYPSGSIGYFEAGSNNYTNFVTFGGATGTEGLWKTRVRAYVDVNNNNKYDSGEEVSEWSNQCKIVYDKTAPLSAPILLSPDDGAIVKGNPTQSWSPVADIDHYFYESYYDYDGTDPIYDTELKNTSRTVGGMQTITFYWRVRAVDAARNEGPWSEMRELTIDNTFPAAPKITQPNDGDYFTTTPILAKWDAVTDTTDIAKYQVGYVYDDHHTFSNSTCSDLPNGGCRDVSGNVTSRNHTPTINEQGGVTIYVRAIDNAGNIGSWSDPVHYTYDETAPEKPNIDSSSHILNTWSKDRTIEISWSASDSSGIAGYSHKWDTNTSTIPDTTSEGTINSTTSGNRSTSQSIYFHIRAVDNAGNWSDTTHYGPFWVDANNPTVKWTNPLDGDYVKGTVSLSVNSDDVGSGMDFVRFRYGIDTSHLKTIVEDNNSPYETNWNTTSLNDGNYVLRGRAFDNSGRSSSLATSDINVIIDNTGPSEPAASPIAGDYDSDQIVTLLSLDVGSGLDEIYYTLDGTEPDKSKAKYTGDITIDHDLTLKAIAYDVLGNASSVFSGHYGVPPIIFAEASSRVDDTIAVITWTTDDLSTSRVVYDTKSHKVLGAGDNYGYAYTTDTFDKDPNKIKSHSVTITGLTVGTTYYFRPVSHGSPEATGKEIAFTPYFIFGLPGDGQSDGGSDGKSDGGSTGGASAGVLGASTSTLAYEGVGGVGGEVLGAETGEEEKEDEEKEEDATVEETVSDSDLEKDVLGETTDISSSVWQNTFYRWLIIIIAIIVIATLLYFLFFKRKKNKENS